MCIARARAPRRTASGSHQAASRATAVVPSWISLDAPPMTPASARAASPPCPAMTPTRAGSVRSTPSSVVSFSPGRDQRTTSFPAGHAAEVEGVGRLAHLDHHVVGQVHHVVDRADPHELEPVAQPERARHPPSRRGRARRSARTGRAPRSATSSEPRPPGPSRPRKSASGPQRQAVQGRHLASHAVDVHAVDAVGGDVEVEDGLRPRVSIASTARPAEVRSSASLAGSTSKATDSRSQESGTLTTRTAPGSAGRSRRRGGCRRSVADHRHPLDAQAEGEAGDLLGVVDEPAEARVHRLEDRRVHHARAEDLEPARGLADPAGAGRSADRRTRRSRGRPRPTARCRGSTRSGSAPGTAPRRARAGTPRSCPSGGRA